MNASGNLLDALAGAGGGRVLRQLAGSLGLPEETVMSAARSMVPALAGGLSRNLAQPGGTEALSQALATGNHARYVDDPQLLAQPESIADGNAILGHVFGSKDVSRNVAGFSAGETGNDPAALKKMLPMLASAVMGVLATKTASTDTAGSPVGAPDASSLTSMLGGLLDMDTDGSPVQQVLNLAKRFFQR